MPLDPLPLDSHWPEIERALRSHRNMVLVAEPGAGKTTRFPPRLLELIPAAQKVLVLEPRRLAARASSLRIASERGWTVGGEVGYQVRFENKTGPLTRLQFLTEGLFNRRLLTDPDLKDVGAVVLDEFHERSQHTDLALALLFELQSLARPDLKIIVMSATLDSAKIAQYLGDAPIVHVKGRTYPVDLHHSSKPLLLDTGPDFLDRVAGRVLDIAEGVAPRAGDVLVFLPGAREIRGVRERLFPRAERAGFTVVELYGSMPLADQDRAIRPDAEGRKKLVLATNIAETSLTIDGVGTVVDSGLARVARTDAFGFSRLQLSRISLASATQRAGRAGRQFPGHAYRLWTKLDEASMSDFDVPELLRSDLTDPLLTLLAQGITDPASFSWFERPPNTGLAFAQETLTNLGFRSAETGQLTTDGKEALKLPLSARLARLVIEAVRAGRARLGAQIAALLSERDIVLRAGDLKRTSGIESDVVARLGLLNDKASTALDHLALQNVKRVAAALTDSAARLKIGLARSQDGDDDTIALKLLLKAYPDRVCRRRQTGSPDARMVGAKGVRLSPYSLVETAELFVALDASEAPAHVLMKIGPSGRSDAQISLASRIERKWIQEAFPNSIGKSIDFVFDPSTLSVLKRTAMSFRDLPIEEAHLERPTADDAFSTLIEAAENLWESKFIVDERLTNLTGRVRFLNTQSAANEAFNFDQVRRPFLEEICFGETRLAEVLKKPLDDVLKRYLPSEIITALDKQAPESITVPSGSQIRIQYPDARAPFIEVRLQELFGLLETPRLGAGRVPLTVHLLGPNYRPVQVTADLASFWRSGYNEVRKELRFRYPKHSWPEDPLTARPEAKGRRRPL